MRAKYEGWLVRTLVMAVAFATTVWAIRPMASYRAIELGATTAQVGLIAAAYSVLSLVLAIPVGRLTDRLGEGPLVVTGGVLMVGTSLWLLTIDGLVALGVSQALIGVAQLTLALGMQSTLTGAGNPAGRDHRIGALTVFIAIGQILGPALAGWAATGHTAVAGFAVAVGSSGVVTVFAISLLLRGPATHERSAQPDRPADPPLQAVARIFRIPTVPRALLVSMVILTSNDILVAYLPVYGEARGIAVSSVTMLLTIRAAASIVSRLCMVGLLDLLGRRRVLLWATLLPALAIPGIPLSASVGVLAVLLALAGFGQGLGGPLTLSWVAAHTPVDIRATALGLRITGNRFGQMTLPAAVGLLATAAGLGAVFVSTGVMLAAGATLMVSARDGDGSPVAGEPPPD
jgi:MFS family permease